MKEHLAERDEYTRPEGRVLRGRHISLEPAVPLTAYPPLTWARFVRQALGLAVVMMSSLGCYLIVLKWRGGDARFTTFLPWDAWIPFEPAWVWIYLLPYLIGPAALGIVRPSTFRWYVSRGLLVVGISLLIFILVPTQIAPRSSAHGLKPGITAQVYQNMVAIDEPPANAAPSLHVSLTCLLGLALYRDFPKMVAGDVALRGACLARNVVHATASLDRRPLGMRCLPCW